MVEYRVTKYDPALRDDRGAYIRDEWTSFADIGRTFNGAVLTEAEYRSVEQAYVDSAVAFAREGGLSLLTVRGLEHHKQLPREFREGSALSLDEVGNMIRQILRDDFWCRFESPHGFLHFGWDFYMYIGVPQRCPQAERQAEELGLYAEEYPSPYKDEL